MSYWWITPAIAVVSFFLTAALRRYAITRSLLDIPNQRSSHSLPTPRGGGVAIVLAFIVALVFLFGFGVVTGSEFLAIAGAGGVVAVIGFMDDHGHIAARWRLLGHFLAAVWGLYWLGGLPPVHVFGRDLDLGLFGQVLAAFYLVWLLNLYNFMDGIDGIASAEAICVCLGAALVYAVAGASAQASLLLALAAAVAGFLYWNFPPARIFMGDAGSGFLGIILGLLSLQAAWISSPLLWAWIILLGVFIVDATVTLIRRLVRGDKVYEAHRSHAYQFAARKYGKHLPVTSAVVAINVFWLLPIALCVVEFGLDGALGVVVAYVPLVVVVIKLRAGELEH